LGALLFFFFLKKFNERKIKIKLLAHLFIKQKLHHSFLLFTFGQKKKMKKRGKKKPMLMMEEFYLVIFNW